MHILQVALVLSKIQQNKLEVLILSETHLFGRQHFFILCVCLFLSATSGKQNCISVFVMQCDPLLCAEPEPNSCNTVTS